VRGDYACVCLVPVDLSMQWMCCLYVLSVRVCVCKQAHGGVCCLLACVLLFNSIFCVFVCLCASLWCRTSREWWECIHTFFFMLTFYQTLREPSTNHPLDVRGDSERKTNNNSPVIFTQRACGGYKPSHLNYLPESTQQTKHQ
jgi:hypothetical protein